MFNKHHFVVWTTVLNCFELFRGTNWEAPLESGRKVPQFGDTTSASRCIAVKSPFQSVVFNLAFLCSRSEFQAHMHKGLRKAS